MGKHSSSESRAEVAARELLAIRGWDLAHPPKGHLLWRHEYRQYPILNDALAFSSKKGHGRGFPDFIVVDPRRITPLIVGETKATSDQIDTASSEAIDYAKSFAFRKVDVLAVGVAGSTEDDVAVRVHKRKNGNGHWRAIEYRDDPIQWLPTPEETQRLLFTPELFQLDPEVPPPDVLYQKADEINRILRECRIKDERRPAAVAAFMLGLWKTRGELSTNPEYILLQLNTACRNAFREAGKHEIEESIALDSANDALAAEAHRIVRILKLLNVTTLTGAHDYLGQLYEHFFRFTGGNTIGQFFTPRHITKFMADICDVTAQDIVVDPACGTGGFLIASLYRMIGDRHLTHKQISDLVSEHLWGFETEPITAALCVANMILRGDGTTGVVKGDCFVDDRYPINQATVALGNPPFPHKKSDAQPENFVDRALDALRAQGKTAMVVPASMLVKSGAKQMWRTNVLRKNTLLGVIKLPDELFEPYASAYTNIAILRKGRPHRADDDVFWARIENDGFRLKKTVRVEHPGEQLSETLEAFEKKRSKPGWYGWSSLTEKDWSPGAYIESAPASEDDLRREIDDMLRSDAAWHARYADQLSSYYKKLETKALLPQRYANMTRGRLYTLTDRPDCLGHYFNIFYGQRELHSKEWLDKGDEPIISSSGEFNGCYGFFDFARLIAAPFATVPSTGSIGVSFVQRVPCGVTDDCLLLFPKDGVPMEALYVAAAVVRLERWRFSYGRKITPRRISFFKYSTSDELLTWIGKRHRETARLARYVVETLSEEGDSEKMFRRLAEEWTKYRPRGANVADMVTHPAYQRIIGMGHKAVPYLLEELARKPGHWFWALHTITGANPVPPESEGSLKKMAAAWIEWGIEQGYMANVD